MKIERGHELEKRGSQRMPKQGPRLTHVKGGHLRKAQRNDAEKKIPSYDYNVVFKRKL